jgi:hypothetical protein
MPAALAYFPKRFWTWRFLSGPSRPVKSRSLRITTGVSWLAL